MNYCRSIACGCWQGAGSPECSNFDSSKKPFAGYDDGDALHRARHWLDVGEDQRAWISLFQSAMDADAVATGGA